MGQKRTSKSHLVSPERTALGTDIVTLCHSPEP